MTGALSAVSAEVGRPDAAAWERLVVAGASGAAVPLVVVDGPNLLYRALHGFPPAGNWTGCAAAAVAGTLTMLRAVVQRELRSPPEVVVCFDGRRGCAWRQAIEPAYKQRRPAARSRARVGLERLRRLLTATGLAWVELDDQEADDVIASLVALGPERPTAVVSADQDLIQLVTEWVWVLNIARRPGERQIGPSAVYSRYGVTAAQWCDYRALVGDSSDNIPGVYGVGPRTAARLLADGVTLEDLQGTGRLSGPVGDRITAEWEQLLRWRALFRLRRDLPLSWRPSGTPSVLPNPAVVLKHLADQAAGDATTPPDGRSQAGPGPAAHAAVPPCREGIPA
jgi:5'-3' exonuclease